MEERCMRGRWMDRLKYRGDGGKTGQQRWRKSKKGKNFEKRKK